MSHAGYKMISSLLTRVWGPNVSLINYSASPDNSKKAALILYKHLMRQCDKLPKGAKQHYKFQIKQSYKQYKDETDHQRIEEIIAAAYKDIDWIMKKAKLDSMKVPLITSGCTVPLDKFWTSILIYHDRPNIVNKKVSGVTQLFLYEVECTNIEDLAQYLSTSSLRYEVRKLPGFTRDTLHNLAADVLFPYDKSLKLKEISRENLNNAPNGTFLSLRVLIPKLGSFKKCIEIAILNKMQNRIAFHAIQELSHIAIAPRFPYSFEWLSSGHIRILVDNFEDADTASAEWLVDKVFPKIMKWASNEFVDKIQAPLSLINLERYMTLYHKLKDKYGKSMTEVWTEVTDPLKFVYEDVAIATYLICLWESIDAAHKPTFLDLGCGNGLLVHILSQEGYDGYGIDVRKRKIWDIYPQSTKLFEQTIIPSAASLFPDVEWIIGNHSDELTPWIPIIAMRSSYKTNFFLLPCCSYEFSGDKYSRTNTSKSQYLDYLGYVHDICKLCGFIIKTDKLRIPSTKRISIVSYGRTYKSSEFQNINDIVTKFIENRSGSTKSHVDNWVGNFKPRNHVEKVQNCTHLNRDLIHRILLQVLSKLLQENVILLGDNDKVWNKGSKAPFNKIISSMSRNDMKQLKDNCGGLQTLLRNHRYIFEVERGQVGIRVPKKLSETTKYKDKPCWFVKNHPDGCPNLSESCAYKHDES